MESREHTEELHEIPPGRLVAATALATAVCVGLQAVLHLVISGDPITDVSWLATALGVLLLTPVHELLHALGFRLAGVAWSDIRMGFHLRWMLPWTACGRPIPVRDYRRAVLLPVWVTGVVPWIVGIVGSAPELAFAGAVLSAGAAGDVLIWWETRALPSGSEVTDLAEGIGFRPATDRQGSSISGSSGSGR